MASLSNPKSIRGEYTTLLTWMSYCYILYLTRDKNRKKMLSLLRLTPKNACQSANLNSMLEALTTKNLNWHLGIGPRISGSVLGTVSANLWKNNQSLVCTFYVALRGDEEADGAETLPAKSTPSAQAKLARGGTGKHYSHWLASRDAVGECSKALGGLTQVSTEKLPHQ